MCRPSLFYFGNDINKFGPPDHTCLKAVKKTMMENSVPYTVACSLLATTTFFIFLLTFCMFRKIGEIGEKERDLGSKYLEDFSNIEKNAGQMRQNMGNQQDQRKQQMDYQGLGDNSKYVSVELQK